MNYTEIKDDAPQPNPQVDLPNTLGSFIQNLSLGDKGSFQVTGTIIGERMEEEDDTRMKTIRLNTVYPLGNRRI